MRFSIRPLFLIIPMITLLNACTQSRDVIFEHFQKKFSSELTCGEDSVTSYNLDIYRENKKHIDQQYSVFSAILPHLNKNDQKSIDYYLMDLRSPSKMAVFQTELLREDAEIAYIKAVKSQDCQQIKEKYLALKESTIKAINSQTAEMQHDLAMFKGIAIKPESCVFIGSYLDEKIESCYENASLSSQQFRATCAVSSKVSRGGSNGIIYSTKCPPAIGYCANSKLSEGYTVYKYLPKEREKMAKIGCELFGGIWHSNL